MEFSAATFAAVLALVGVVIIIASLMSGFIERSNFPQVAVFLALGAAIGAPGLGMLNVSLDSPILRVVATLSLALVLFTDALSLNIAEARKHARLAVLVLGPATMMSAALITLAGWWLVGLPLAAAAIVGAALASTDPVLLRGLLRSRNISGVTRQALRLESGLNDVVLLPVVMIAMTFLGHTSSSGTVTAAEGGGPDLTRLFVDMFLLGPGAGVGVGLLAVATLDLVRRRIGVRRDYESIYSLGVAFAAFALAESVHGSGFLAAFAAGLTISALDVELCDCFLEYGETTAEMALLFTFVLFGSSLIWSGLEILSPATLLYAALVFAIRPLTFGLSLFREKMLRKDLVLISWFGPRGLSTLLLVLLPVFDGVEGGAQMFAVCALVVLFSVVLHGGSIMAFNSPRKRAVLAPAPPAEPQQVTVLPLGVDDGTANGSEPISLISNPRHAPKPDTHTNGSGNGTTEAEGAEDIPAGGGRLTLGEIQEIAQSGARTVLVDARTERTFDESDQLAAGAVRLDPNSSTLVQDAQAAGLPKDAWLAIFCA